jgi:uncharacterized repeat protein (TIGR03803 family)
VGDFFGTVFSVPVTGGTPTTLYSFDSDHGAYPVGGLTLVGSTLYGTTAGGGRYGDGTVFGIPATGGMPTLLFSFGGTDGANPNSGLTVSGSTFYGVTEAGGANGYGTAFSLTIPEPSSLVLLGGAMATLACRYIWNRRRQRHAICRPLAK